MATSIRRIVSFGHLIPKGSGISTHQYTMDSIQRIKQINELKAVREDAQGKHDDLVLASIATQETILKSFKSLINYLENKVSRTEVVNQLREIATPDVDNVVTALDSLHNTIKEHKNTDLTEITSVMQGVLNETKKIPKELPKTEKLELKDYSKQLSTLETTIKNVEKAIKAQKLNVEAPVVNVPETVVNVEKPDLKPLETSITTSSKDVVKAVKGIKIPELNTDPVEKLLKKTNKLLEELPELMPSGGSGSGSSWVATNSAGVPIPIQLNDDGSIPVTFASSTYKLLLDDYTTTNVTYVGKASIGSATSASVWQIQKIDETSGMVITWGGTGAFDQEWDERAGTVVYA